MQISVLHITQLWKDYNNRLYHQQSFYINKLRIHSISTLYKKKNYMHTPAVIHV